MAWSQKYSDLSIVKLKVLTSLSLFAKICQTISGNPSRQATIPGQISSFLGVMMLYWLRRRLITLRQSRFHPKRGSGAWILQVNWFPPLIWYFVLHIRRLARMILSILGASFLFLFLRGSPLS